jgi:hypothetical protein
MNDVTRKGSPLSTGAVQRWGRLPQRWLCANSASDACCMMSQSPLFQTCHAAQATAVERAVAPAVALCGERATSQWCSGTSNPTAALTGDNMSMRI